MLALLEMNNNGGNNIQFKSTIHTATIRDLEHSETSGNLQNRQIELRSRMCGISDESETHLVFYL